MAIAGYAGQVALAAAVVGEVKEWNIDIDRALLDTTAINTTSGWKTFIPGLAGASGSLNCNFNMTDAQQTTLQNAVLNGTTIAVLNLFTAQSGSNRTYSGAALIHKLKVKAAVAAEVTLGIDFTFTGAVTFA